MTTAVERTNPSRVGQEVFHRSSTQVSWKNFWALAHRLTSLERRRETFEGAFVVAVSLASRLLLSLTTFFVVVFAIPPSPLTLSPRKVAKFKPNAFYSNPGIGHLL